MLSEIKLRYACQCVKCGRDMREGWAAFFEPEGKKIYCKPCGQPMWVKEQNAENKKTENKPDLKPSAGMVMLEDILAQCLVFADILPKIEERLRDLETDVSHLDSFLRDKKPAKKKE